MISEQEKLALYNSVNSSNMKKLSWKYNNCKNTCVLPIQCTFNIKPIFYKIVGNYEISSNKDYNTIITFTEDATTYAYVPIITFITIALKSNPNFIIFQNTILQKPGAYFSPAGSLGLIIKSYFNIHNC